MHLALPDKVETLDPARAYDTVSGQVISLSLETLYQYDYLKRPYQLTPLLASDLPINSHDGKSYTIKIKQSVYYHPSPWWKEKQLKVTASDFVNAFKRIAFRPNLSKGYHLYLNIVGLEEFAQKCGDHFDKFKNESISGVKAIDDTTLIITLKNPDPSFIYLLALPFTSPIPQIAIDHYENNFHNALVGTGPFILQSHESDSQIKFKKNRFYTHDRYPLTGDGVASHMGLLKDAGADIPFLEGVHFKVIRENQTRVLEFLSGNLDLITLPKESFSQFLSPSGDLKEEYKKNNIELQVSPVLTLWWISINMEDPFLKNKYLRKAIAHAINREKYLDLFAAGHGQIPSSIFPPGVTGHRTTPAPIPYDLSKAKYYLEKAGHPMGLGLSPFTFDLRGNTSSHRMLGEFIQQELSQIGIEIEVVLNPFPSFLEKSRRRGTLQLWQGGWAMDYPDPLNMVMLLTKQAFPPGPNTSFYFSPQLESLYQELQLPGLTSDRRDLLLSLVDKTVVEDCPWILLNYETQYTLIRSHFKNLRRSDLIPQFPKYLKQVR